MSKKIKIIDGKEFELTKQERLTTEVVEYLCSLPAVGESEVPDFNSLDDQCFKRFSN